MNRKSRRNLQSSNMNRLAMTMALPHENKPVRLPLVPVCQTALIDTMADGNYTLPSGDSGRRVALVRDPCYPVWAEREGYQFSVYLVAFTTMTVPANAHIPLLTSGIGWDRLDAQTPTGATWGGVTTSMGTVIDETAVLAESPSGLAMYMPLNSVFVIELTQTTLAAGSGKCAATLSLYYKAEWVDITVIMDAIAGDPSGEAGYRFSCTVGSAPAAGTVLDNADGLGGIFPSCFVACKGLRTYTPAVTAMSNPNLLMGFTCAGASLATPATTKTPVLFTPLFPPPEFKVTTAPYKSSRANATAALLTNVTAVMNQEGSILAGRLKPTVVDLLNWTENDINDIHPSMRYFGPAERGLYTFTTPTANDDLQDRVVKLTSFGSISSSERPLFNVDHGVFNAIVITDTNSSGSPTKSVFAVSQYTHVEFESTSTLFSPGISMATLESLHAAEVALNQFGVFHENPIHWAALAAAAKKAFTVVAPMIAPIVQHYGQKALNAGVAMMRGKEAGERSMPQRGIVPMTKTGQRRTRVKASKRRGTRGKRS